MSSMFAFQEKAGETLEQKALRICEVILSSGVGIRGGEICAGGNNVMAKNSANAITDAEIQYLIGQESALSQQMGVLIQNFKNISNDKSFRDNVVLAAIALRKDGLLQSAKPTNFDINAAGARFRGYAEPKGLHLEFAQAFHMLPKSSPNDRAEVAPKYHR